MPDDRSSWWIRRFLLCGNLAAPPALLATGFREPAVVAAAAVLHGAFATAVMRPQCRWFGPVVTRVRARGDVVWLTIDDGPAGESATLARELERRGVAATFFVKGANVRRRPEAAREILACGHTLGNHTHTHPAGTFAWLRPSRLRREIDECQAALAEVGAPPTGWFRSPVGLKHARLHPALRERGLRLIAWTVRGRDGVRSEPAAVVRRVATAAHPGAIILLHEDRPRTCATVLGVVDALRARGLRFIIPGDEELV